MQTHIADLLIGSVKADLDSPAEWVRADHFFYNALQAVHSQLPEAAQKQLTLRGPELPPVTSLEEARVVLWKSIADAQRRSHTPRA